MSLTRLLAPVVYSVRKWAFPIPGLLFCTIFLPFEVEGPDVPHMSVGSRFRSHNAVVIGLYKKLPADILSRRVYIFRWVTIFHESVTMCSSPRCVYSGFLLYAWQVISYKRPGSQLASLRLGLPLGRSPWNSEVGFYPRLIWLIRAYYIY